jgi:hypothetical protein
LSLDQRRNSFVTQPNRSSVEQSKEIDAILHAHGIKTKPSLPKVATHVTSTNNGADDVLADWLGAGRPKINDTSHLFTSGQTGNDAGAKTTNESPLDSLLANLSTREGSKTAVKQYYADNSRYRPGQIDSLAQSTVSR